VVEPHSGGSSVGIKIVYDKDSLLSSLKDVFKRDSEVVIEKYIKGEEITCTILDGKPLPIISIQHTDEFLNYHAKYDIVTTIEGVVKLPATTYERVAEAAIACYRVLKCNVYARVDMIIKDGTPYVMEVNTLPGVTKSAHAAGIPYNKLLNMIIESSLPSLQVKRSEGF
jgi:D-alanine-D-alanine ligase